ncbi:MAG TPA: CDP-alcohol phosphatidyltransferase family protein [Bacteroidia bacterium]|nr:CDP-alcohol phosphatidyltransferase family protein [Bacteroidia bacterium]
MKHIPKALIYSRLVIGVIILGLSILHANYYNVIAATLLPIGLLTDIFDGIIARRLNISTQHLRRLDSTIDQLFFTMVIAATFIQSPQFFYANYIEMIVLVSVEALTYLICFLKFKKEIATHAISSKIWTLILVATLMQVIITTNSTVLFQICFYSGLITRVEIILIIILLREWTNDVPSIYQAILLRKGKAIKRNKLFNG